MAGYTRLMQFKISDFRNKTNAFRKMNNRSGEVMPEMIQM